MKTTAYKSISKTALTIAVYAFALIAGNVTSQNSYRIKTEVLTEVTSKLTQYEVNEQDAVQFRKALTELQGMALHNYKPSQRKF